MPCNQAPSAEYPWPHAQRKPIVGPPLPPIWWPLATFTITVGAGEIGPGLQLSLLNPQSATRFRL
jgi:hypothetical protein